MHMHTHTQTQTKFIVVIMYYNYHSYYTSALVNEVKSILFTDSRYACIILKLVALTGRRVHVPAAPRLKKI